MLPMLLIGGACLPAVAAPTAAQADPFLSHVGIGAEFSFSQPYFEAVGDAQSIAGGVVTALAQDASGMLWIGTHSGLVRYDGYHFRKFVNQVYDTNSLNGDFVTCLLVAKDGRLWVGTRSDGISVFDPKTERFESYQHDPANPDSLSGGRVWALADDDKGGIWVGTNEGLDYLGSSGRLQHFLHQAGHDDSLADDRVRALLLDHAQQLWVGTANGLQKLGQDRLHFETIAPQLRQHEIRTLFEAKDGKLWIGMREQGAAWLDPRNAQLHRLAVDARRNDALSHSWIYKFAQPLPGQIWIGTYGGGINVVDASDGRVLQRLFHDPSLPSSLAMNLINTMLSDRSGLLWIGTFGGGLQRYNPRNQAFRLLRHSPIQPLGLSHSNVRSVLELGDGRILVGTGGNGIDIIDRKKGLIDGFRPKAGTPGRIADGDINAIAQTPDGTIWVGTGQNGVQRLLPGSHAWQTLSIAHGLPDNSISNLLVTHDGALWVGSSSGVAEWLPYAERFQTYAAENQHLMGANVLAMVEDRQNRIWIGSSAGLWVHEPGASVLARIRYEPQRSNSLSSDRANGLLVDRNGRLWVDTANGLDWLQGWDGKRADFEHIGALFGRLGVIFDGQLVQDPQGRIWSHQMLLDPEKMRFHEITKADGMDIGTSWYNSFGMTRDGLILFGGTQGLAVIKPELFNPGSDQPPVVATALKVNGRSRALGALSPQLQLNSEDRDFTIEFAALDFSAPLKVRYLYRLKNYNDNWLSTDAEHRSVSYGNLWPGDYVLEVRGSNRRGEWSPNMLVVPIRILPAFWQTPWFLTLVLALIIGLTYGTHRWRLARLHAQTLMLRQAVESRTADILKLSAIGQELTATLDTEQAFERVYRQVSAQLDAFVFGIGIYDAKQMQIRFVYEIANGVRLSVEEVSMNQRDHPAVWCVRERRELLADNSAEMHHVLGGTAPDKYAVPMASIIYQPLLVDQRVIGCLSVQSPKVRAYSSDQLEFLHVLTSYTAIAVANSRAHQSLIETQQQLVLQEKMAGLGTLTAGVAHEINNPTNFAHVAAQNLRVDLHAFEQLLSDLVHAEEESEILDLFKQHFSALGQHVSTILNGTERIKGIVRDLRSFTRHDEADKKSVRLSECLQSTLNLVRTNWMDKVEFLVECVDDPEIECWPALLNQVFMNLLVNACQAIEEKQRARSSNRCGQIHIRLYQEHDWLLVSFEDDGIGISPGNQTRILEPFYTTKTVGEGTGLGLSIAYGIMQKHGGTLRFLSTPGVGSLFIVNLPFNQ
jgi:signal transduction histidine kinase/ligand-binding sensor domain-containing protein